MSEKTLGIILIIAVIGVLYFWNNSTCDPEGFEPDKPNQHGRQMAYPSDGQNYNSEIIDDVVSKQRSFQDDSDDMPVVKERMPQSQKDIIMGKYLTRDTIRPSRDGNYKRLNYSEGKRGGDKSDALDFIDDSNDLLPQTNTDNDMYTGRDETDGKYAQYRPETNKRNKYKTSEIFNSKYYLPNEKTVNPDWFEVVPEAISVKNRHLINVSKPIGVNTIGTSLRNASWDLRSDAGAVNPKFTVAPWLQSTIEPDVNRKSLC